MMTVIVTVFEAAGLTVSEKKTRDDAVTDTGSDTLCPIARDRSSWPEVWTDDPVLIPRRLHPRNR